MSAKCGASVTPLPEIEPVIRYVCRKPEGHEGPHSDHMKTRRGDIHNRSSMVIAEYPTQAFGWTDSFARRAGWLG